MGFLKELFQKKLQDAASMESLEVGQRVRSEYSLPQLRQGQQSPKDAPDDGYHGAEAPASSGPGSDATCTLIARPEQSAKSFSYVPVRKRQVEAAEQAARAEQVTTHQLPPQAHIKYESISQFSQKVELYRGSISTVLKGVCVETGGKVIIKAYHKSKMHPKHFHKLQRELSCMRVLRGAYVADLYTSFEDVACVYMVMEYCEGGDLFKTMLMHGGALEEQWVCVEVIAPLLRILEKMHSLKLLHRDIKPENIFLTALGKFKLGDFGLAIKYDEEIPFSRSGTLDYMAPEVLKNPSVPFQEGRGVDLAMLSARGVAPYGPPVDVWAAGVLAYELVCGRPPFEVEDEAQTAALIMYSDSIKFPSSKTPQWADFVRSALVKNPEIRPNASQLLQHPWVILHMQRCMADNHRPSKELLLQPLPLAPPSMGAAAGPSAAASSAGPMFGKRTSSFHSTAPSSGPAQSAAADAEAAAAAPTAAAAAAAKKLPPKLSVAVPGAPQLPSNFPATPTAHLALAGGLHKERLSPAAPHGASVSAPGVGQGGGVSASGAAPLGGGRGRGGGDPMQYGLHSPMPGAGGGARFAAERAAMFGSPDGAAAPAGGGAGSPGSAGGSPGKRLSHLSEVGHAGGPLPAPAPALARGAGGSPSGSGAACASGSGSPLRPSLKVALPEFELTHAGSGSGDGDGVCYSPSTPAGKSGMKERMKFYFQRQAGQAGGL